jgi:hypothetical protein
LFNLLHNILSVKTDELSFKKSIIFDITEDLKEENPVFVVLMIVFSLNK